MVEIPRRNPGREIIPVNPRRSDDSQNIHIMVVHPDDVDAILKKERDRQRSVENPKVEVCELIDTLQKIGKSNNEILRDAVAALYLPGNKYDTEGLFYTLHLIKKGPFLDSNNIKLIGLTFPEWAQPIIRGYVNHLNRNGAESLLHLCLIPSMENTLGGRFRIRLISQLEAFILGESHHTNSLVKYSKVNTELRLFLPGDILSICDTPMNYLSEKLKQFRTEVIEYYQSQKEIN